MNSDTVDNDFFEYLSQYITPHKKQLFEKILNLRTKYITVVLEDIFKPHNASAVLRTSDCFGIQDIHIVEGERAYEINRGVVKGASKWLDLYKYSTANEVFLKLRKEGYKIVGTSPHAKSISLNDLKIDQKIALMFGNEDAGLSDFAIQNCDELIHVPMYGFTESFNISVTAAICLNTIIPELHQSDKNWKLTEKEKAKIKLEWYKLSVTRLEILQKEFYKAKKKE